MNKKNKTMGVVMALVIAIIGASWFVATAQAEKVETGYGINLSEDFLSRLLQVFGAGVPNTPIVDENTSFGAIGTRFPNGLAVGNSATATQYKLTVGSDGDPIGNALFGTCNADLGSSAVTATSSYTYWCSDSAVNSGDTVFAMPASTTPANFDLVGAEASTTDGFVGFTFFNRAFTAGDAFPGATATTGLQYFILRP